MFLNYTRASESVIDQHSIITRKKVKMVILISDLMAKIDLGVQNLNKI